MNIKDTTYLDNLPVEHPRARIVCEAEAQLIRAFVDVRREYNLTIAEELQVLTHTLSSCMGNVVKYMIRYERHGRGDKPGDLE